jgi:hypothetical protein
VTKKEKEKILLQNFRDCCPECPSGEPYATESPDFLIPAGTGKLGIELTLLYRNKTRNGGLLQEQESLRRQIADKARQICESQGCPHIHVNVHFNDQHVLCKGCKGNIESSAKELASLILDNMPEHGKPVGLQETEDNWEQWPATLSRVSIERSDGLTKTTCCPADAGFVPKLEPGLVQSVIDKKDLRCSDYRRRCEELWLLVVAGGFACSSWFTVDPDIITHAFVASFDRVFLFQNCEKKVFELRVDQPDRRDRRRN